MKHTLLTILTALAVTCMTAQTANAQNVDKSTAQSLGAYYLSAQIGNKAVTPEALTLVYEIDNPQFDNLATLYVFNLADNGYVVVAGNKIVDPIIAHSTEGSFDPNNIPPAFLWWLNQYVQIIAYAQTNDIQPDMAVLKTWEQLEKKSLPYFGSAKGITILLKSKWDQGDPYNRECPMKGNQHCLTGCVATAMAQIMHYWRYPYTGDGIVPDPMDPNSSIDLSQGFYNQGIMPDQLTASHSQEQIHAVALLNYHCGAAARMSYDTAGSGSNSDRYVPIAYWKNFKYVKDGLALLDRNAAFWANGSSSTNAKDTLWFDTCKREILAKRPIFYTGYDSRPNIGVHAGHAFVCDGYNSVNKQLHFNWGWGGSSDGWCNVITSSLNAGGYKFQSNHNALIGLTPPADTVTRWESVQTASTDEALAPAYPNPASTQVTIPCRHHLGADNTLRLYDASGRLVMQREIHPYTSQIILNVGNLQPGIYIYRINDTTRKLAIK